MTDLLAQAESLGIKVKPGWSNKYIQRQITMANNQHNDKDEDGDGDLVAVELLVNYRPIGKYEVLKRVESPYPGVGSPDKLWAGTEVRLPKSEASALIRNEDITTGLVKDENGNTQRRKFTNRRPLARMDVSF